MIEDKRDDLIEEALPADVTATQLTVKSDSETGLVILVLSIELSP